MDLEALLPVRELVGVHRPDLDEGVQRRIGGIVIVVDAHEDVDQAVPAHDTGGQLPAVLREDGVPDRGEQVEVELALGLGLVVHPGGGEAVDIGLPDPERLHVVEVQREGVRSGGDRQAEVVILLGPGHDAEQEGLRGRSVRVQVSPEPYLVGVGEGSVPAVEAGRCNLSGSLPVHAATWSGSVKTYGSAQGREALDATVHAWAWGYPIIKTIGWNQPRAEMTSSRT